MSRPAAPAYSVPNWATGVNYPAGSDTWSGQPTKVSPPSTVNGFVPNTGAAAEYMNYELNAAFTADASAKSYLGALADGLGQGEVMGFDAASFTNTFKVAHDAVNNRWIASASLGAGDFPFISYNGGRGWTSMAAWPSSSSTKPILGSNPAGLVVGIDGFSNKGWYLNTNTATWVAVTLGGLPTNSQFREMTWLASGNKFIAPAYNTTGTVMIVGTGAANWVNTALPSPLSGAGANIHWTCSASPTRFVGIPRTASTGSNYMTSDDAVTFTNRTTLPTPAGFTSKAVHYNASEALWMLAMVHSTGTINTYTSSDALTWTLRSSLTSTNWEVWDLSSAGGVWAMLVQRDVGVSGVERATVIYSVDDGVTWRLTDASNLGTSSDPSKNQIVTDGSKFIWNTAETLYVGQHSAGLKAAIT